MADLDRLHPAAYRILPAREEDVRWAAALGARVYGGDDVIPEATMVEWFRANPNGFSTFWCGEARVGNFDLLPLRAAPLREFVAGRLLERHVRGADLFSVRETPAMCAVHFESIVIDPEFAGSRSRMMKVFMLSYLRLLGRVCPLPQVESVYAIAASAQGTGVLRRLGFVSAGDAAGRLDGHPLFRATVEGHWAALERYTARTDTAAVL